MPTLLLQGAQMHIKDISITSIRRSMDGKRLLGDVTFEIAAAQLTQAQTLVVSCDAPYSKKIRADAVLVGDAIRQLRRLPELRSGQERLSFEPGMNPLSTHQKTTGGMDRPAING